MFLYTFLKLLLLVVSIINTFTDVESSRSSFLTSPIILFIHIYWIILLVKALLTGTYICRTTNILNCKRYTVHWTYLSFATFPLLEHSFYKMFTQILYVLYISFFRIDYMLPQALLFVNTIFTFSLIKRFIYFLFISCRAIHTI